MHNSSTYVQEFANKQNAKAVFRALTHLNFKYFTKVPYQQPTRNNFEGTKRGEEAIFLSYSPSHVKELLQSQNFNIVNRYGCSYLRSSVFKKLLGDEKMIQVEKTLQKIFKKSDIPPSISTKPQLKETTKPKTQPL
jgi:hypothetical protein